jgi:hypothetical protein
MLAKKLSVSFRYLTIFFVRKQLIWRFRSILTPLSSFQSKTKNLAIVTRKLMSKFRYHALILLMNPQRQLSASVQIDTLTSYDTHSIMEQPASIPILSDSVSYCIMVLTMISMAREARFTHQNFTYKFLVTTIFECILLLMNVLYDFCIIEYPKTAKYSTRRAPTIILVALVNLLAAHFVPLRLVLEPLNKFPSS